MHVLHPGPAAAIGIKLLAGTVDVELEPALAVGSRVDDEAELVARARSKRDGARPDDLAVGAVAAGGRVLDHELLVGVVVDVEGDILLWRRVLVPFLPVWCVSGLRLKAEGGGEDVMFNFFLRTYHWKITRDSCAALRRKL